MSYAEAQYVIDETISGLKSNMVAGLEPNNLVGLKFIPGDNLVDIVFTPKDTVIEGQTISSIAGIIIRRKEGDYPVDENDGYLVANITGDDLHDYYHQPFVDDQGVVNGTEYYYRLFPYNTYGMINKNKVNKGTCTPTEMPVVYGFHQDFTNSNPSTSITYIEDCVGFTPAITNTAASGYDSSNPLGSWSGWKWLGNNRAYILRTDLKPEYRLMDSDYAKANSNGASKYDYSTSTRSDWFGAYAWFPKIYMKEVYSEDGSSRDVYFATTNKHDRTRDYIPVGFIDFENKELEGLWIPMFPTVWNSSYDWIRSAGHTQVYYNATTQKKMSLVEALPSDRTAYLGGPIMNVIRDVCYLLYKHTNIQTQNGSGYSANGSYSYPTIIHSTGGAFYGNNSGNNNGKYPAKIFHSYALGSFCLYMYDPYNIIDEDDNHWVAPNYPRISINHFKPGVALPKDYVNTGKYLGSGSGYIQRTRYMGDGFGSFPYMSQASQGTENLNLCDYHNINLHSVQSSTYKGKRMVGRLGYHYSQGQAGLAHVVTLYPWLNNTDDKPNTDQAFCPCPMFLPKPGYTPYDVV